MDVADLSALQTEALRSPAGPSVFQFQVRGGSMRPTIWPGWSVEVERASLNDCRLGDIVLWCDDDGLDQWVLHRLVRVTGTGIERMFQTRGDGRSCIDRLVSSKSLFGRLVTVHAGPLELRPDRGAYATINQITTLAALHASWLLDWLALCLRSAGRLRQALRSGRVGSQ